MRVPTAPSYSIFYSSLRPSSALLNVTSSVYSRSPPTGIPWAILVTFIPIGFTSFEMYIAVASPSTLGFVARINSFTVLSPSLDSSSFSFMSSGPIPFIGDIEPCSTWYTPLYSCVLSIAIMSFTSSTTHIWLASLFGFAHIGHGSVSVML